MPSEDVSAPSKAHGNDRPATLERVTLERLYDAAPEPVALVEPRSGQVAYMNATLMELAGLRPHAARRRMKKGLCLSEILALDNGELDALIADAASLQQSLGSSSLKGNRPDGAGNVLVLTVTASPIDDFGGSGPMVVVTFRNTTAEHRVQSKYQRLLSAERRHAEELETKVRQRTRELAEAQEELLMASRLAAVGEVAGAAAHEVFNPLTAVAGNLDRMRSALRDEAASIGELHELVEGWRAILAEAGVGALARRLTELRGEETDLQALQALVEELADDVRERERTLTTVCNASRRIERIVQGMLGMSGGQTEPEALSVSHVFREVRDLMAYSFERAGVQMRIEAAPDVEVYADRGELLQILTNLLRNGCQAASQANGSNGGWVRMTAVAGPKIVEVCVEDNGVGVPHSVQTRIFESGFTTKRRGEGTGLGLPISRRLVRRNGGDLVLRPPKPGSGASMLLTLPVPKALAAEAAK